MPRLSLPLNHKYALKALFLKAKKVFSSKGGNPCARGAGCWVSPFPPPPFSFPRDGGSRAESSWVGFAPFQYRSFCQFPPPRLSAQKERYVVGGGGGEEGKFNYMQFLSYSSLPSANSLQIVFEPRWMERGGEGWGLPSPSAQIAGSF